MKSIVFLGDSLTAGNLGSSYFRILKESDELADAELINLGEDGFTMAGLLAKLESFLETEEAPDLLVLEGGANDILLPHMQSQGKAWDPFIRKLLRHGSRPAESEEEFRATVSALLDLAETRRIPGVLICTIPFITEDLSSPLNRKRIRYNSIMKDLTDRRNGAMKIVCLDMEGELAPLLGGSPYLFRTPMELQDDAALIMEMGENEVCRQRNLTLTIDGAHPNRRGAELIAREMLKALRTP